MTTEAHNAGKVASVFYTRLSASSDLSREECALLVTDYYNVVSK